MLRQSILYLGIILWYQQISKHIFSSLIKEGAVLQTWVGGKYQHEWFYVVLCWTLGTVWCIIWPSLLYLVYILVLWKKTFTTSWFPSNFYTIFLNNTISYIFIVWGYITTPKNQTFKKWQMAQIPFANKIETVRKFAIIYTTKHSEYIFISAGLRIISWNLLVCFKFVTL